MTKSKKLKANKYNRKLRKERYKQAKLQNNFNPTIQVSNNNQTFTFKGMNATVVRDITLKLKSIDKTKMQGNYKIKINMHGYGKNIIANNLNIDIACKITAKLGQLQSDIA